MTSKITTDATSSPESEGGTTPCDSPGGRLMSLYGQQVSPASPSVPQGNSEAPKTSGTCGPSSETSSKSADLQSSLESRLRANLEGLGSPLYKLTWKHWDIRPQQPICALRASGHRTSVNVSTGALFDGKGNYLGQVPMDSLKWLRNVSELAGWPTSKRDDGVKSIRSPEGAAKEAERKGANDLNTAAVLVGWPTPAAKEAAGGEYKDPAKALKRVLGPHSNDLRDFAKITGPTLSQSPVLMANRGQLNPALSRWLMGYPVAWDFCGGMAMQLCRKSRKFSSAA